MPINPNNDNKELILLSAVGPSRYERRIDGERDHHGSKPSLGLTLCPWGHFSAWWS